MDTYLTAANLTKDNGTDLATYITAYDLPDYPLTRVFKDKAVNLAWSVGQSTSNPIVDSDHYPMGYQEECPIAIFTVDQSGITGVKLLAKADAELRRICETYPTGSLRRLTKGTPKPERMGGVFMWRLDYAIEYVRDLT